MSALQRVARAHVEQARAARRNHHGIDHERHARRFFRERRGHGLDHIGIDQHAGLDAVGADIVEHGQHLRPHELGRDRKDAEHPFACSAQ